MSELFLGVFILLSYISIGTFGLFEFNHMFKTSMVDCPYAQNSYSLCENSLDHINNWRQFSNTILPSFLVFLILIITLGIILYFFDHTFFDREKHFYKWKYYLHNKQIYTYQQEILRWLSLFENSPSFLRKVRYLYYSNYLKLYEQKNKYRANHHSYWCYKFSVVE